MTSPHPILPKRQLRIARKTRSMVTRLPKLFESKTVALAQALGKEADLKRRGVLE